MQVYDIAILLIQLTLILPAFYKKKKYCKSLSNSLSFAIFTDKIQVMIRTDQFIYHSTGTMLTGC